MTDVTTCANPGCNQPGTSSCGACRTISYCGTTCQTADWPHHKVSCPGHLRKLGKAHMDKAIGFHRKNWAQTLRHAELALMNLKKLKDRNLATIQLLDEAMSFQFDALNFMGRCKESLECATERYNLWAETNMRDAGMIEAAFALVQSLINNKDFAQAHLIAGTIYEMTTNPENNNIPDNKQQHFLARASHNLARSTIYLAKAGGIPPEEKQKAGEEAIMLARKSVELHTLMHGANSIEVAVDMGTLGRVLDHFNDVDDDEVLRLFAHAKAIHARVDGSLSVGVALGEDQLARAYSNRAKRAIDLDELMANWELSLHHFREAARIFRAVNRIESAVEAAENAAGAEYNIKNLADFFAKQRQQSQVPSTTTKKKKEKK